MVTGYSGPESREWTPVAERPHRSRRWVVGGALTLVVLLGAGAAVWKFAPPTSGGAGSPESLALDLVAAVREENPLALSELIAPGDASGAVNFVLALRDALGQLGYDAGENGSGLLDGIAVEERGVEASVEPLADGVALMTFTGGIVGGESTGADPGVLLSAVSDEDFSSWSDSVDIDEIDDPLNSLIAVEEDDRWFVSPSSTWASWYLNESALEGDWSVEVNTAQFATPEDALTGFIDGATAAAVDGDIDALARVVPPTLGRAISALADAYRDDIETTDLAALAVDSTSFSFQETDGGMLATVDSARATGEYEGDYFEANVEGGCADFGSNDRRCLTYFTNELSVDGWGSAIIPTKILVREVTGGWLVDPFGSVLADLTDRVGSSSSKQLVTGLAFEFPALADRAEDVDVVGIGNSRIELDPELESESPWGAVFGWPVGHGAVWLELEVAAAREYVVSFEPDRSGVVAAFQSGRKLEMDWDKYEASDGIERWSFTPSSAGSVRLYVGGEGGPTDITIE